MKKGKNASHVVFLFLLTILLWSYSGKVWSQTHIIDTFNTRGHHMGFNTGLGITHELPDKSSSEARYKEHFAFNIGINYFDLSKGWIGFHYRIQYKKFFLKTPDDVMTMDFISGSMGIVWNIKNFIITLPGLSFNAALRKRDTSSMGGLGMYGGIGYMFRINKELIMPVEAEADMVLARSKILIGIYLKFTFLFKL